MRLRSLAGLDIEQHSSPNVGGPMVAHHGLVLHIAQGYYRGTIGWQLNPDQRYSDGTKVTTSSTWVVGKSWGEWAQMVDTDTIAWCQGDGSRRWNSVELEGFAPDGPTPWQLFAVGHLLAWGHDYYGWPIQIARHPGERGFGHHSMDREGVDRQWGHDACPGAGMLAAKPRFVQRAKEIAGGVPAGPEGDLMSLPQLRHGDESEDVGTAQGLLLARGQALPKFGPDHDFGNETKKAVEGLQAAAGLPVTGVVDDATWGVLLPGLAGLAQLGTSVAQLADRPPVDPKALAGAVVTALAAELDLPAAASAAVEKALRQALSDLAGQI